VAFNQQSQLLRNAFTLPGMLSTVGHCDQSRLLAIIGAPRVRINALNGCFVANMRNARPQGSPRIQDPQCPAVPAGNPTRFGTFETRPKRGNHCAINSRLVVSVRQEDICLRLAVSQPKKIQALEFKLQI